MTRTIISTAQTCPSRHESCNPYDYMLPASAPAKINKARKPESTDKITFSDDLKISSGNKKTGASLSIPEGTTCPGQTESCSSACYVKFGRMSLPVVRNRRQTNLRAILRAIKENRLPELLVDAINKSDAKKTGSLRIHDSGDFFSPAYCKGWIPAIKALPGIKFWAYSRSFTVPTILPGLIALSGLPNCKIWLSADRDNWKEALETFQACPSFAGIAFMQDSEEAIEIAEKLTNALPKSNLIVFPVHASFGRVTTPIVSEFRNCPAITGELKKTTLPACLACKACL